MRLFLLSLMIVYNSYAQTEGVTLTTKMPEAGQKITVAYRGRLAIKGSKMFAVVYKSSRIDTDIKRIPTVVKENQLIGDITLPDSTSFFVIKIENKNEIDNNGGEGYCFNIFKDSKPLKGTYFTQGYVTYLNKNLFKGEINFDTALRLFEKEYLINPDFREKTYPYFLQTLSRVPGKELEAIQLAKQKYIEIIANGRDERFSVLYSYIIGGDRFKVIDSLVSQVASLYPKGAAAFNRKFVEFQNNSYVNTDLALKNYEEIHDIFPQLSVIQRRLLFSEMLRIYAQKNDFKKIDELIFDFLNREQTNEALSYLAIKLNDLAILFLRNEPTLLTARVFVEKAIEARRKSDTLSIYYGNVLNTYATVLFKLGQKELALSSQRKAIELMNNVDPLINQNFIEYLIANNHINEAKISSEEFIKGNVANVKIDSLYGLILDKVNGENRNLTDIQISANDNFENTIRQSLINEEAYDFELKDLEGNKVQLSDFKGKIVILDFWATWCGPCIKAFPAMQIVKNELVDQNVKFLFIDTLEEVIVRNEGEKTLYEKIRKIIQSRNLNDFHILIDPLVDNLNQTAKMYKVSSIPAKIVIDKYGKIRYVSTGFSSNESLIKEIKTVVSIINED